MESQVLLYMDDEDGKDLQERQKKNSQSIMAKCSDQSIYVNGGLRLSWTVKCALTTMLYFLMTKQLDDVFFKNKEMG